MALTKPFKETVMKMAREDPEFRKGLLTEAGECFLNGEIGVAKSLIRDYVNATLGFQQLAAQLDKKPQSLMRMLSEKGNPRAENLSALMVTLQKHEGIHIECRTAG